MLIEGSIASNKTAILRDKYVNLLNSGAKASEILVLVQNSTLKSDFSEKTFEKLTVESLEKMQIHSFYSLVYNTVCDNWAFLEERNIFDNPVILPNMAGLEVSQFIFKDILKEVKFKGYNSRMSLLHQIFRRYSLIVQNNLSQDEVNQRAEILKEGFSDDADLAIKKFMKKTLQLRDFDYLRQCLLFNFIYKNTKYFDKIKYLIIDDADELTPICIDFIRHLAPQIKECYIAIDPLGSSRCGYLSADKNNYTKLLEIFGKNIESANENTPLVQRGQLLFNNILKDEKNLLKGFHYNSFAKRTAMTEAAINKINELLYKEKAAPCEIAIISPVIDDMLKFSLKEGLKNNINHLYLSGSEKHIQNRLVKAAITILKLNTTLKNTLGEFDIRIILSEFLQIPLKYCEDILENFQRSKVLIPYDFSDEEYNSKYETFRKLADELSKNQEKISDQLVKIYNELFSLNLTNHEEINKYNFFIKQIRDFENIFGSDFNKRKTDIIIQAENSIIAENPYSVLEIGKNDLIISTPQKIIDNHIRTKYQIWLDITSSEWIRSDTGPLYNAWVFQKDWFKKDYTLEDNLSLSKDKNARVLRKLSLNSAADIYCYSSLFDSNGIENYGGIEPYIIADSETSSDNPEKTFDITPREDQKPVLAYKSGYMGISAVPGAGKTTILLALIIKLLEQGVNPEKIFVLTYMDSAARNFRERIKKVRNNSSKLPNISTIHGLALKILKENGNYEKLGLSGDFEICDDSQRGRILHEISNRLKLEKKSIEEFDRAISIYKFESGAKITDNYNKTDKKLSQFIRFFEEYQNTLKEYNLIDYDDMLTGSVKILKENPDILEYYQSLCEYIIEDEAQDSSPVQQELIKLLSGKYNNIIRCGDVNQSITATFSNADVEGFRRFITDNTNVSMNCSQRCTQDVWELANKLVKKSCKNPVSANAFFEMYMQPVADKNPKPLATSGVLSKIFENSSDEKIFVLNNIKEALSKHPKYTIGILLRNNYQVSEWQNLLENSGLTVITRSQCLEQKTIFRAIFAVMKMILTPFNNNIIADGYQTLTELGFYKRGLEKDIQNYENPFISLNADYIEQVKLQQFYWDLNYWVSLSHLLPHEIAIKAGLHFFNNDIEKANIYLISTLIKRICIKNNTLEYAITTLKDLSKKPNLSGFKFFSEEDEDDKSYLQGKVQIMTMHKSKGDEFNLVFLPELTEKNITTNPEEINIKSSAFIESVKSLNPKLKKKSDFELKQEILAETLRLFYVAVTRAKNQLVITAAKTSKNKYGKIVKNTICSIFQDLLNEGGEL